jgi:hypothetical protein
MPHLAQTRVVFCDRTIVVKAGEDVNVVHNDGTVSVGTVESLETRGDLQPYLVAACEFELWAKLPTWAAGSRASLGLAEGEWEAGGPSTTTHVLSVLRDSLARVDLVNVYLAGGPERTAGAGAAKARDGVC